jgi:hypothetical protein
MKSTLRRNPKDHHEHVHHVRTSSMKCLRSNTRLPLTTPSLLQFHTRSDTSASLYLSVNGPQERKQPPVARSQFISNCRADADSNNEVTVHLCIHLQSPNCWLIFNQRLQAMSQWFSFLLTEILVPSSHSIFNDSANASQESLNYYRKKQPNHRPVRREYIPGLTDEAKAQ